MGRKAQLAAKALGHLLQLVARPLTLLAAKGAGRVFVVGADDELASATFGTDQLALVLEFRDQADMGAGEMVHEHIIAEVDRAASIATAPKRRQGPTART